MPSRLAIVLALVLLAGCAAPPPPADRVTPPTANESTGTSTEPTTQDAPPVLAQGENDDMRVTLAGHSANASATTFEVDVRNKRSDDVRFNYAHLQTESGVFYLGSTRWCPRARRAACTASTSPASPGTAPRRG
jgi:hypothetical protein